MLRPSQLTFSQRGSLSTCFRACNRVTLKNKIHIQPPNTCTAARVGRQDAHYGSPHRRLRHQMPRMHVTHMPERHKGTPGGRCNHQSKPLGSLQACRARNAITQIKSQPPKRRAALTQRRTESETQAVLQGAPACGGGACQVAPAISTDIFTVCYTVYLLPGLTQGHSE